MKYARLKGDLILSIDLTMETVQRLDRDYRPTPDPVTANMAFFSRDKSIPGNSTDLLDFFFKPL